MKFFGGADVSQGSINYILVAIRITVLLKRLFIYYCDSYIEPKIKHENPRRRFELSDCFLVI